MNVEQKRLQSLTKKAIDSGLRQVQLGKQLGVTQMSISRFLHSPPANPRASVLRKLEAVVAALDKPKGSK